MIHSKNRFHGHGSLNFLYKNGKTVRGSALALKYSSNSHRTEYRLAVVVSKKVSKSAVVRNRIRRRLYEVVRLLAAEFVGPYDLTLLVYDVALAEAPTEKLQAEVAKLLQKAAIISGKPTARGIVKH